jgi:hypothetical protein
MLSFHRLAGTGLVANEEEAYRYWIRTVSACLMAERAYGPSVVHRLHYAALINNPESAMRSLLASNTTADANTGKRQWRAL